MRRGRPMGSGRCLVPAVVIWLSGTACAIAEDPGPGVPGRFPAVIDLGSLTSAKGFSVRGAAVYDSAGYAVSCAGDMNGDGIDDILIGVPLADRSEANASGQALIVFGGPEVGAAGTIDASSLDGDNGFRITGAGALGYLGWSTGAAGDVNDDGFDDVILGAPFTPIDGVSMVGRAYVVFGGPNVGAGGTIDVSALNESTGIAIDGIGYEDGCATSVSGAGDINGDGIDDLAISTPYAGPYGRDFSGETYVVFGAPDLGASGGIALESLDGTNGFVVRGAHTNDQTGMCVAGGGDVNNDSFTDLLIGTPAANHGTKGKGGAYVLFGGPGVGATGVIPVSSLKGTTGFVIMDNISAHTAGTRVAWAGDVNQDGFVDMMLGTRSSSGSAYIVFGGPGVGATGSVHLGTMGAADGVRIPGIDAFGGLGSSVAGLGDVNGDGADDVVVGAGNADPNGSANAGSSYVLFGGPEFGAGGSIDLGALDGTNGFVCTGARGNDRSGWCVSSAGDVNADGVNDVMIGAPLASRATDDSYEGEVSIVFGRGPRQPHLCPADIDGDAFVDVRDFSVLAAHFAQHVAPGTNGDLDGNGVVNGADFNILARDFGCGW